jgi:hypothetical protein
MEADGSEPVACLRGMEASEGTGSRMCVTPLGATHVPPYRLALNAQPRNMPITRPQAKVYFVFCTSPRSIYTSTTHATLLRGRNSGSKG